MDWKSIDPKLMYALLSLPSEVDAADRLIKASAEIATAPDFEDWFIERRFHYCRFGLTACQLSEQLAVKYGIQKKTYNEWEPAADLRNTLTAVTARRAKRMEQHTRFIKDVLHPTAQS